ncbi:MAG: hypothetical protein AAF514_08830 [Verrucomicrobiota bacterium]
MNELSAEFFVTKGRVIFGSSAGVFMTCVNPDTGELIWRCYVGGPMEEAFRLYTTTRSSLIIAMAISLRSSEITLEIKLPGIARTTRKTTVSDVIELIVNLPEHYHLPEALL